VAEPWTNAALAGHLFLGELPAFMAVDHGYALGDDVPPRVRPRRDRFPLNQSDLLRFLGDIQWFPATALSKYVTWDAADAQSARATMS